MPSAFVVSRRHIPYLEGLATKFALPSPNIIHSNITRSAHISLLHIHSGEKAAERVCRLFLQLYCRQCRRRWHGDIEGSYWYLYRWVKGSIYEALNPSGLHQQFTTTPIQVLFYCFTVALGAHYGSRRVSRLQQVTYLWLHLEKWRDCLYQLLLSLSYHLFIVLPHHLPSLFLQDHYSSLTGKPAIFIAQWSQWATDLHVNANYIQNLALFQA